MTDERKSEPIEEWLMEKVRLYEALRARDLSFEEIKWLWLDASSVR